VVDVAKVRERCGYCFHCALNGQLVPRLAYFFEFKNAFETVMIVFSFVTIVYWIRYTSSPAVRQFDVNAESYVDLYKVSVVTWMTFVANCDASMLDETTTDR
jgi:hypothetical protein